MRDITAEWERSHWPCGSLSLGGGSRTHAQDREGPQTCHPPKAFPPSARSPGVAAGRPDARAGPGRRRTRPRTSVRGRTTGAPRIGVRRSARGYRKSTVAARSTGAAGERDCEPAARVTAWDARRQLIAAPASCRGVSRSGPPAGGGVRWAAGAARSAPVRDEQVRNGPPPRMTVSTGREVIRGGCGDSGREPFEVESDQSIDGAMSAPDDKAAAAGWERSQPDCRSPIRGAEAVTTRRRFSH
ncbi:hypothetical protein STBA_00600 [Streptomyces sp. MP131-18]|nr:hypothetical protein STBA_00600 [Streptomyces sp. MP131-18]